MMHENVAHAHLRKLWRAYWKAWYAQHDQWEAIDRAHTLAMLAWQDSGFVSARPREPICPPSLPFPDELRGLTCGAKTRAGTPCKLTEIFRNGRCKFNGGASTGPRTHEGKAIASRNARKRTP